MDGPTGPLTTWEATETQAKKTTTINGMLEAASPAMLYGYNAAGSSALTWAYFGGNLVVAGAIVVIADGTVTLTAGTTNYVEADPVAGTVTVNQTAFDSGKTPLYKVTCSTSAPVSWQDWRQGGGGSGSSGATTTTATFTIAAIGSNQVIDVVNPQAFPNGEYIAVSDGTHAIQGLIVSGGLTTALTVETIAIVTGAAGNTMATSATVTFSGPQGATGNPGPTGHGATTTTASFTVAAVGSTQSVPLTDATAFPVGAYSVISDGTHAILGQVTALSGLNATVMTIQINAGAVGNTMASGATVSFSGAPATPAAPNAQTGTSYTLAISDAPGGLTMNNAAANTVTVPPNSSVPFPVGTIIPIAQLGAGQTGLAAGAGVTLNTASSLYARVQYSVIGIWQTAANVWEVFGDMQ